MDHVNSNLGIIVNKLFENKFYSTFIKNRKNYLNINYFLWAFNLVHMGD